METLENRLRSWSPRRPSAKIEARLFGAPTRLAPKTGWLIGSLAPAAACLLLTLSMFNPGNTGRSLNHEPLVAMILSNQNYAAYASDNFRQSENNLAAVTFDWTNHSISTSNTAPF
jgi:hypothetical protein